MTPAEFAAEGRRLSRMLEAAQELHRDHIGNAADAERDYRKAKSEAWVRCPSDGWTAARKEAWVNAHTADHRHRRDVAEGMIRHSLQVQRNALAQMSYLQSEMNVFKAEANFAQYGPSEAA